MWLLIQFHTSAFRVESMNNFTRRYFENPDKVLKKGFLCESLKEDQLEQTLQRLILSLGKTSANLQKVEAFAGRRGNAVVVAFCQSHIVLREVVKVVLFLRGVSI